MLSAVFMMVLQHSLDGKELAIFRYTIHCNVFYDINRGDDQKGSAAVVWIDSDGTWRDRDSILVTIPEVARVVSNQDRPQMRVRLIFRDDKRNMYIAFLQVVRLLGHIADQRRVTVYMDFIPLAK